MPAVLQGRAQFLKGNTKKDQLGIGIVGSGFYARFHLHAFAGVRDADIRGIWSSHEKNASEAARLACSEIRNLKMDCSCCRMLPAQFAISDFGFEMQDSSNFKIPGSVTTPGGKAHRLGDDIVCSSEPLCSN